MKKIVVSLIVLICVLVGMNVITRAEMYTGSCGDNLTYIIDTETGVFKINGTGDMYDYEFRFDDHSIPYVKAVPWNMATDYIKTLIIEDGVTSIGEFAFSTCRLKNVTIPDSVTSIGDFAFRQCTSLASITIPDSITSIGNGAFMECATLTSITIPDSVTSIGDFAFWDSGIKSIIIPDGTTSIGESAFWGCVLTSVTFPDNMTSIGKGLFEGCVVTSITIPDGIKSIDDYAFRKSTIKNITIPDSVKSIGQSAFEGCSRLTSITIPDSVKSIGAYAFSECKNLNEIIIPDKEISIDQTAFLGTPYADQQKNALYYGNHLAALSDQLVSYKIKEGTVTVLDYAAFSCGDLEAIIIPKSVVKIGKYAFLECWNLEDVYYAGSEEEWDEINIHKNNRHLKEANMHFNFGENIEVKVNDEYISFDQKPVIQNGRTLVPVRAIFEALGATVEWDNDTQTVTAVRDNVVVKMKIGSNIMNVSEIEKVIDVPAQIIGERTMVPVRAVSEAFGCNVEWKDAIKTVVIEDK